MRRLLTLVVGAIVVLGGFGGLMLAFSARDEGSLETPAAAGPGRLEPDRGASHERAAERPAPGELPTSGPHRDRNVTRDERALGPDELLQALEQGNVVLVYGEARPPAAFRELQEAVAGPFDAELAVIGQSIILARRPGLDGYAALAWRRSLRTDDPADPQLRDFAEAWLGKGLRP